MTDTPKDAAQVAAEHVPEIRTGERDGKPWAWVVCSCGKWDGRLGESVQVPWDTTSWSRHILEAYDAQPAPNVEERARRTADRIIKVTAPVELRRRLEPELERIIIDGFRDLEPNAKLRAAAQELVDLDKLAIGKDGVVLAEKLRHRVRRLRAALDAAPEPDKELREAAQDALGILDDVAANGLEPEWRIGERKRLRAALERKPKKP